MFERLLTRHRFERLGVQRALSLPAPRTPEALIEAARMARAAGDEPASHNLRELARMRGAEVDG